MARRVKILIDIARRAEKDYLSKDTPESLMVDAKRVLFGEVWFRSLCNILGISCEIARLHIISWKSKGKVGDPVFGFLNKAKAYENYVSKNRLSLPNVDKLTSGIPCDERSPRTAVPCEYKPSQPGSSRN